MSKRSLANTAPIVRSVATLAPAVAPLGRPIIRPDEVPGATAGQWQAPPKQTAVKPAPQVQETAEKPVRLRKDGMPWGKTGPSKSAVPVKACNVSLPDDLWNALDAAVEKRAKTDRRFNRSALIEEIVRAWETKQKAKRAS